MKEFESLELRIIRNQKWLDPREKQGFFLSFDFPLQGYKLPETLSYLQEDDIDQLRAIIKLKWQRFITEIVKELEAHPPSSAINRKQGKNHES